ncbi:3'-5' exonuclease domain-containing protein 2 [Akkermansiaceae bacterium]|nr:3'-5' exonuclease domain-containing protein 2 [Akkermansiaceae bacterium]
MSTSEQPPQKKTRRRRPRRDPSSTTDDPDQNKATKPLGLIGPTKAETALLPPFAGLSLDQIHIPSSRSECHDAVDEILATGIGGFDTEAKPTFRAGQKSTGPHVVQFSLTNKAYIFQLHHTECEKASSELITSTELLKVGFGLSNDHSQIRNRFGIDLNHVLDLDQTFRKMGYRGQIGARGAMGVLLKQCFKKSKSTTTSNWARPDLSDRQLTYAANDAYAALKIMEALKEQGHL